MVIYSINKPFSVSVDRHVSSYVVHRSILEYIVHQKKANARKMREYQKQLDRKQQEVDDQNAHEQQKKLNRFLEKEATYSVNQTVKTLLAGKGTEQTLTPFLATPSATPKSSASTRASTNDDDDLETPSSASAPSVMSSMVAQQAKQLPSFWIPSLTPAARRTEVKKPDQHVYCPISSKPIAMKDLIDVKFKLANDVHPDKRPLVAIRDRYVCAVTGDLLGNSVPCAVLRTSGNVVTMDCVNRLIKLDMTDPITGEKLTDYDIIPMQRGGTGKNLLLQNMFNQSLSLSIKVIRDLEFNWMRSYPNQRCSRSLSLALGFPPVYNFDGYLVFQ